MKGGLPLKTAALNFMWWQSS